MILFRCCSLIQLLRSTTLHCWKRGTLKQLSNWKRWWWFLKHTTKLWRSTFSRFHKACCYPWFVFDLSHQARSSLKTLESRKGFELKILKALRTELTVQTQNMLYHLGEEWQKLAVWKLPPSKGTRSSNGGPILVPLSCVVTQDARCSLLMLFYRATFCGNGGR